MKRIWSRAMVRMLAGAVLGLLLAIIWMGSLPGAADAQCGGTITAGSTLRGEISRSGTTCSYYFDGRAGDVVTIRITKVSSSVVPYLDLYTPQGKLVKSSSLISNYTLSNTGRYRIRARDYSGRNKGSFTLSLQKSGFIGNQLSGKCIDVDGTPGTANGAPLQLWDCEWSGTAYGAPTDQKWELTPDGFIKNMNSGKCIDVDGAPGTTNGAPLQLWDCEGSGWGPNNSSTDQRWTLTPDGFIVNQLSGKCIDARGSPAVDNGAPLQLWDCDFGWPPEQTDQRWVVR